MKKTTLLLISSALIFLSGCAALTSSPSSPDSVGMKIQNILGNILPPDFSGDFHITEHNPWFTISGTAKNVHKNAAGQWTWDAFIYDRSDMLNTGAHIELSPTPKAP